MYQGSLYAAGTFTSVGAQSCNRIAKWNGTQWQPVDVGVNGTILAMAVYNNELYVGGQFSTAGGPSSTALNIARWNGSFWSALSPDGVSGGNPVGVNSLYVWNNQLFVGGAFDSAGGTVSRMVARWGCPCYANCDNSTIAPVLNVNDYVCFLSSFVAGSPYANCDASTTSPVLNILDYTCFMSKFASGCP